MISTLSDVIKNKEYFINATHKDFPHVDRDTIDGMLSEVIYNILRLNKVEFLWGIEKYVLKGMKYKLINTCEHKILNRPTVKSTLPVKFVEDMTTFDYDFEEHPNTEPLYKNLRKHIKTLPEYSRDALLLRIRFKMIDREIAAFYNIPRSTVKSRIHWGKKLLREILTA